MRLDFNVLWVEDQPNNVSDQMERIASQIRKEGFRLAVKFAPSVDDATKYLDEEIYGDHVDLILMDYDLGPGKSGDEGLTEVRAIFPYKDLIFYSAKATADLAKMASKRNIQGIFTAHRPDLPGVVEEVFRNLVRKVLDIDHSRGIVMGATSDIDKVIFDGLSKVFDGCNAEQRAQAIQAIQKRLDEKQREFEKSVEAIKAVTHVTELTDHHRIYTSDDRFRLLQKLMKQLDLHKEHSVKFNGYRETVMPKRNDLAHIRVEKNGFSRKFYDSKGAEVTAADMRALRVALLEFQEILDAAFPE
ncbi:response regulator [Pararhizobium mangrovi]|uniref:Response regulator n=1 Tax=Pararhizobium mangrovi TaxID=2590452 RepID=A0A506TXE1_9HYPH|nr:response regulator [Pararhizobium mangrovi]TPW26712.1 response regulator [Pararhizobium mangrovi]